MTADGFAPNLGSGEEEYAAAETLAERDARLDAWLANVKPGDRVTVRLNSTDTLTGKVYEAPDARGVSLCVWTTVLRHGNGYPGGSYEPSDSRPSDPTPTNDREAQDVPNGFVRLIHDALCPIRKPHGMCEWPTDRGATVYDAADAAWNSDLLAARERAAAEKARADERERIALAIEACRNGRSDGNLTVPPGSTWDAWTDAAYIARSQP